jgi:hypothetical protein
MNDDPKQVGMDVRQWPVPSSPSDSMLRRPFGRGHPFTNDFRLFLAWMPPLIHVVPTPRKEP